jgi:hypothetical protein
MALLNKKIKNLEFVRFLNLEFVKKNCELLPSPVETKEPVFIRFYT